MSEKLLPTTVVGSYPQPGWLVDADRLIAGPDCGMKYLPRRTAFKKLQALADGARIVRERIQ